MRTFVKHNGLSIFFLVLFLAALVLQAFAGHADFNEDQLRHDNPTMSLGRYVISSEFGVAVLENWQSEYLQFTLFILATVWLLQRGSPESKELHKAGRESDGDQLVGPHAKADSPRWAKAADLRRTLYENSLLIVMAAIWLGSWFAQSITGVSEYNAERLDHHQLPVSWFEYLVARTSGRRPCRTGSRSSSRSGRWRSSRCTCGSADRPSPSPSGPRTHHRHGGVSTPGLPFPVRPAG